MAIIRWNPLNLSTLFSDDWEMPTIPGLSRLGQGLNLYETKDNVVAEVALPGVDEEQVDVSIEDNIVRISGTTTQHEEDRDNRRYFMSQMTSAFNYAFRLPNGVKASEPSCELNNGVLTLTFEKEQKAPPKRVKVTSKQRVKKSPTAKSTTGKE